jgi:uncharacterized protein (DUF1778 family)
MTKVAKNVVISAKVTPEIAKVIKMRAKVNGKSVSSLISDMASEVDTKHIVKASKGVEVPKNVEREILKVATVIGGSALVGIIAYKSIKAGLESGKRNGNIDYTDTQIETISTLLGVMGAVITGIGLHKVLLDD